MYHLDLSFGLKVRASPHQSAEQYGRQDKDYMEPLNGWPNKYKPERNAHNTDVDDDVAEDTQGDSYAVTSTAEP